MEFSRNFDLIVLGSGPAGQKAALQGAKAGKRVVLVEASGTMGGGCVHQGTIPSKSFRESVYRFSMGSQGALGQENDAGERRPRQESELPEMRRLVKRKDRVIRGECEVVRDQLTRNHIEIVHGFGVFADPHTIEVKDSVGAVTQVLSAPFVVIATGAHPVSPAHLPVDGKWIHDSDTILNLPRLPRTLAVIGAGIIGTEYASMFSMAGSRVFLIDKRDRILASVDREIVNHLTERFETQDMEMVLQTEVARAEIQPGTSEFPLGLVRLELTNGRSLEVEAALVAMGRSGNTEGMGLETIGLIPDSRGLLAVDAHFRTALPHVYAAGDVIGVPALASTSMEQGRIAVSHAFGLGVPEERQMPALYPYGIYTIPEISTLGPNEEELKAQGVPYIEGRARYRELARGQIVGDQWGMLKLLVHRETLKILGVHIVGDSAANLIHIGQAVMDHGGDVNYFIRTVFNYPTLAEAYKTAAFHAINQMRGATTTK